MLDALTPFLFTAFAFCLGWWLCALWSDHRAEDGPRRYRPTVRVSSKHVRLVQVREPMADGEPLVVRHPQGEVWRQAGTVDAERDIAEQMPRYGEIDAD